MRATNDKLGERYIIVVARELSKALKGLHDAGIMHRDIKGRLSRAVPRAHIPQACLTIVLFSRLLHPCEVMPELIL
jgi:serine/threonine protein kinase